MVVEDIAVVLIQKFNGLFLFLFGQGIKFNNIPGDMFAILIKISETNCIECAFVRENKIDMWVQILFYTLAIL